MSRSAPVACTLGALIFVTSTAIAQRGDKEAPLTQTWNVTIAEDSAVIRASDETDAKFVQATIKALQEKGIEEFALRSQKTAPLKKQNDDRTIAIRLHNSEAEVSISFELPYKYVVAIVSMLADNGVQKVKFAQPESHQDDAKGRKI